MSKINILLLTAGIILAFASCNRDEEIIHEEVIPVAPPDANAELIGFYLLNEGNMGTNKSTLDYMNFVTGEYHVIFLPMPIQAFPKSWAMWATTLPYMVANFTP